jgi:hypothetical protein
MTCARMECKMRGSCAYECDKSDGAPDVVDKFMMMAERAFKQRDEMAKALGDLLEANKTLASLSPFHHNRSAAIAGQEVAERAARDLLAAVVGGSGT